MAESTTHGESVDFTILLAYIYMERERERANSFSFLSYLTGPNYKLGVTEKKNYNGHWHHWR